MIKADSFIAPDGQTIRLWRWPHQDGRDTLFWAHATGFHGRLYQPLLDKLSERFNVIAWDMRGHGESEESKSLNQFKSWDTYYRDLRHFLKSFDQPIILAGHSVGGMTVFAAAALYPQKVKAVFLIEPVIFDRRTGVSFGVAKRLGQGHKMHLAKGAARRRSRFSDKEEAFNNFKGRGAFKTWPDEWLSLYVEHGLFEQDGQQVLACRPAWEARSFAVSEHKPQRFMKRFSSRIPLYILLGEQNSTFFVRARRTLKQLVPHALIQTLPGSTHFVPMEHPNAIIDWLMNNIRQ